MFWQERQSVMVANSQLGPTAPISLDLLPATAQIDNRGRLLVAGCNLTDLVAEFGSPLLVYDQTDIERRLRLLADSGPGLVFYACKAFLCRALIELIDGYGLGFDVSSRPELETVLAAGVDPNRIIFHGNNKTRADLAYGLKVGLGRFGLDSGDEIDRLQSLVADGQPARVVLRITPGLTVDTHQYLATGADDSKFGFSVSSGAAGAAVKRLLASRQFKLLGIHVHLGSQLVDLEAFSVALRRVFELASDYKLTELSLGGGFGVSYSAGQPAPELATYLAVIRRLAARAGWPLNRLAIEPGRSLVARAGLSLYRIGTIKKLPGIRTYVALDGGMGDNITPALYDRVYEAFLPGRADQVRSEPVRLVGSYCEAGDILVRQAYLPDKFKLDDPVALAATGAYTYSMASNYNMFLKPAIVFVKDGQARLVVRRQKLEDLSRLDLSA